MFTPYLENTLRMDTTYLQQQPRTAAVECLAPRRLDVWRHEPRAARSAAGLKR